MEGIISTGTSTITLTTARAIMAAYRRAENVRHRNELNSTDRQCMTRMGMRLRTDIGNRCPTGHVEYQQ